VSESPETTPLSAAEEQAIRRNVAEMAKAEWGDNPGTAYHPEEQCKSERQLVRLLEAFDAARATVPAGQDIVAAAQRVVDAKPVRWNDRPADSFIRAVLDLRYALAARPVPAAEPPVAYDEDGDPIRPDPHNEDWYDGYAAAMRDVESAVPAADDRERLAEIVSDALAATTLGTDMSVAPDPSDEPGSDYVLRLTNELLARGAGVSPSTGDDRLREALEEHERMLAGAMGWEAAIAATDALRAALGEENDRG
jgi:hypothetical protein